MMRYINIIQILGLFLNLVTARYVEVSNQELQENSYSNGYQEEYNGAQNGYNEATNKYIDYHSEPKYSFTYAVHDPHTGDEKQHIEHRDGDVVKGSYSLKEADGSTRIVEYQADNHNGFIAQVHKIGVTDHTQYKY